VKGRIISEYDELLHLYSSNTKPSASISPELDRTSGGDQYGADKSSSFVFDTKSEDGLTEFQDVAASVDEAVNADQQSMEQEIYSVHAGSTNNGDSISPGFDMAIDVGRVDFAETIHQPLSKDDGHDSSIAEIKTRDVATNTETAGAKRDAQVKGRIVSDYDELLHLYSSNTYTKNSASIYPKLDRTSGGDQHGGANSVDVESSSEGHPTEWAVPAYHDAFLLCSGDPQGSSSLFETPDSPDDLIQSSAHVVGPGGSEEINFSYSFLEAHDYTLSLDVGLERAPVVKTLDQVMRALLIDSREALIEAGVPRRYKPGKSLPFWYGEINGADVVEIPWNSENKQAMTPAEGICWLANMLRETKKKIGNKGGPETEVGLSVEEKMFKALYGAEITATSSFKDEPEVRKVDGPEGQPTLDSSNQLARSTLGLKRRDMTALLTESKKSLLEAGVPKRHKPGTRIPDWYGVNEQDEMVEIPWNSELQRAMTPAEGIRWLATNLREARRDLRRSGQ